MKAMTFVLTSKESALRASLFINNIPADGTVEVIVRGHKTKRSLEQNKLMHAIFAEISDKRAEITNLRFSPLAWKIYFKEKFLGDTAVMMPNCEIRTIEVSTTTLGVEKMAKFIDDIIEYSRDELNILVTTKYEDVAEAGYA